MCDFLTNVFEPMPVVGNDNNFFTESEVSIIDDSDPQALASKQSTITDFMKQSKSKPLEKKQLKTTVAVTDEFIQQILAAFEASKRSVLVFDDRVQTEAEDRELEMLAQQSKQVATVRKESVFDGELNDNEQAIVNQRVSLQQRINTIHEARDRRRKVGRVREVFPYVTEDEAAMAICENKGREDDAITKLQEWTYLKQIQHLIAQGIAERDARVKAEDDEYEGPSGSESEEESTDEDDWRAERGMMHRKKGAAGSADGPTYKPPKDGVNYKRHRLKLNDALAQNNMDGWSPARIRAFQQREKNPNAYYYRFLAPGEKQAEGHWTLKEKELFMQRLKEMGADGNWGVFSMTIPGRVGYQCSNFYRLLIEKGHIRDPNYVLDSKGKACYIKGRGRGRALVDVEQLGTRKKSAKKAAKKRKAAISDDEQNKRAKEDEAGQAEDEQNEAASNPLPNFIDPVTLEPVVRPAISPHGVVMGYQQWLNCLLHTEPRNRCPITKRAVHKRELVELTWDNIEQYRSKISTM